MRSEIKTVVIGAIAAAVGAFLYDYIKGNTQ